MSAGRHRPLSRARSSPTLTLDQAIDIALANSRLVKNAALEVGKSEDDLSATKTNRFPVLGVDVLQSRLLTPLEFEFDKGAFGTFPGVGPIPAENTTLESSQRNSTLARASIAQPLSQLYKIGLGVRVKELGKKIAAENARSQRQAVVAARRSRRSPGRCVPATGWRSAERKRSRRKGSRSSPR